MMGASEAVQHIKDRRCFANPNPGFMSQLLQFEKHLADPQHYSCEPQLVSQLRNVDISFEMEIIQTIERLNDELKAKIQKD